MPKQAVRNLILVTAIGGGLLLASFGVLSFFRQQQPTSPTSVVVLTAAPSATTSIALAFSVVDADEYFGEGGQRYQETEPKLVVITGPEGAAELGETVSQRAHQRLSELDYSQYFAVAVFQGEKSDDNYGVQMQSVTQEDEEIILTAQFKTPTPGREFHPIVTSPYQIIAVERPRNAGREFLFALKVAGATLIRQSDYVP